MRPIVIAAATLAFAGPAFAQAVTTPPPKLPVEQVQDATTAAPAVDAAGDAAAKDAGAAASAGIAPDAAPGAAMPDAAAIAPVAAPDVKAPAISEAAPGVLSSWLTSRRIWTTNQPSTTTWVAPTTKERPADWQDIAKVNDIVMDESGQVMGYVADIGGFLGIGAKKVLLGKDAIHLVSIGEQTFFLTNYTKAELEALPDFDGKTVRK